MTTSREHTPAELQTMLAEVVEALALTDTPTPTPDTPPETPTVNTTTRPELPAYIIASIAIICIAVLTGMNKSVPDVLNLVTIGALGIGGAITTPNKQQG